MRLSQVSMLPAFGLPEPEYDPDQFYTPPFIYEPLDKEFGFTLDPCATAESAKCDRYFHAGQDGLIQEWARETVFMNPPYSDIPRWVEKAVLEVIKGRALVVGLLPATRSEQPWWQRHVEPWRDGKGRHPLMTVETRNVAGRIAFGYPGNPTGADAKSSGKFPSVLVIWRPT